MNELTALTVFNIQKNNEESINDRYSEICFEIKSYFLQNPAIPKLAVSKLNLLRSNEEAFCVLKKKDFQFPEMRINSVSFSKALEFFEMKENTWIELFRKYNKIVSQIRLKLSASKTGNLIAQNILLLTETEISYYSIWNHVFHHVSDEMVNRMKEENPKISLQRDTVLISQSFSFLKERGFINHLSEIEEERIFSSLWIQKENKPSLTYIMTELFRIKKLSSHL